MTKKAEKSKILRGLNIAAVIAMVANFWPLVLRRLIFVLSVNIAFTLSNSLAGAANYCSGLYSNNFFEPGVVSIFQKSKEIFQLSEELTIILGMHRDQYSSKDIELRIRRLEKAIENYFSISDISFQPITNYTMISGLKDQNSFQLRYKVYQITDSASVNRKNEMSRMVHGIQILASNHTTEVNFIMDPLLFIKNSNSFAMYIHGKRMILIAPQELLLSYVGVKNSTRHEVQHYLERMKIASGKMTLARIEMKNPENIKLAQKSSVASPQQPRSLYQDQFAVDEVESVLRELRLSFNSYKMEKIDEHLLSIGVSKESLQFIQQDMRTHYNLLLIESMQQFIFYSKANLESLLRTLQKSKNDQLPVVVLSNGELRIQLKVKSNAFPIVEINLDKLLTNEDLKDNKKIRLVIIHLLNWSKSRIENIENELLSFGI